MFSMDLIRRAGEGRSSEIFGEETVPFDRMFRTVSIYKTAMMIKKKINPCIGAAGASAVPMSARVVQDFVTKHTDGKVNPLMATMGPNVAGVIGTAFAAGVFLALLG
jgi:Na+-transporting methylmalonyl-CoA/oxaloacetate decarboxylase beta subunit